MKRLFTLLVLTTTLIGNVLAQQVMTEVHDFTEFANGTDITWGTQTETNESWDRTVIQSIGNRNYWSWIDGKARFSLGNSNEWQIYDGGFQMRNSSNKSFYINRLDAGDIVKIEYCHVYNYYVLFYLVYLIVYPPSTIMFCPVTQRLASLSR